METSRRDPLRGVRIRTASQIGLDDEPIPYSNGPVNDDEALAELRQISRELTQISESLTRLEMICMEIATSLPSMENIQSVFSVKWGQKRDQAYQLLVDLLTDNPEGVGVKQIEAEAAMKGISMQTMRRTKKSMGLKAEKRGTSWLWKWPEGQEPVTTGGE